VINLSVLIVVYIVTALLLAIYAGNAWVLTILFLKHRHTPPSLTPHKGEPEKLPFVTIQLPIFNEALVVERLIDSVVRLDYPAHLLQIQVLDDSTDETTEITLARVVEQRRRGVNIELVHQGRGLETRPGDGQRRIYRHF
jgi:cellulose synthase/poly-beta-1,6-N-acetylglucosamine synthase-like glycosyltransferase